MRLEFPSASALLLIASAGLMSALGGLAARGAGPQVAGQAALPAGLEELATRAYSPTIMDPAIFANLWRSWDQPSRDKAAQASPEARRRMTLSRYGLLDPPYDNHGAPLGFVVKQDGGWAMTCLICHAGSVGGHTILGLPNNQLDFSGIYEDVEKTVSLLHGGKPGNPPFPQGLMFLAHGLKNPKHVDFPEGLLSVSRGTFNSFTFSVAFFSFRDKDLNVLAQPLDLKPLNHYLDAPPLWNVAKKTRFYYDGFTEKTLRPLMQFSLDPSFGPDEFKSWEADYEQIYAWLHTLQSPKYQGPIDEKMASEGEKIYSDTCWTCHGTPGRGGAYRNKIVPIDKVQTDRGRIDGLSPEFKAHLSESWIGQYGKTDIILRPEGYVAPPLDGIWASAPYLHNGSVPTLYHMLFPDERPAVWKVKDYNAYDDKRMGLAVEEYATMPETKTRLEKRSYYDTHRPTMSNKGHPFANDLTREQRLMLLEYLKTL